MELPLALPEELEQGVARWAPSYSPAASFFVVRDDVVLASSLAVPHTREAAGALARFLAAIEPGRLARVDDARPVARFDEVAIAPFDAWALVHPSASRWAPSKLTTELLEGRVYQAFPCFRCEIADAMEPEWAAVQLAALRVSDLSRQAQAALRTRRAPPPRGKRARARPEPRPARPQDWDFVAPALAGSRDHVDVENYARRVLHFADRAVTVLPDGPSRPIAGWDDVRATTRAFLERDVLADPLPPDVLEPTTLHQRIEAASRDQAEGTTPVDLFERITGRVIARLFVRLEGATLHVEYERLDARLSDEAVPDLVRTCFLAVHTRHFYRGKASTLALEAKDRSSPRRELPYVA